MKTKFKSALSWSEKYTKTDMKYLVKGGFSLVSGQLGSILIALIFASIISRILPKEVYGNYKYMLSLVELTTVISLSGLAPALVRAVAQGHEGTLKKFHNLSFIWSILPASILTLASIYYYTNNNHTLAIGLLVGGLTLPFLDSGELYNSYLNGKKLFKIISITAFVRTFVSSLIVLTVAYFTNNALYMTMAFFIAHTILVNIFFFYTLYKYKPNTIVGKDAENLGKHTTAINFLALISDRLDDLLIFHYLGAAPLATYNFAKAIPENIQGLVKQLGFLATPKFAEATDEKSIKLSQKNILRKSFIQFLFTVPIVLLYWISAPYIFAIIFPNYMDSVFYTQLISLGLLINASIPLAFLDAHKAIKEKYIVITFSNILKIPLIIFCTYGFGLLGLIFSKIISKIFGIFVIFVVIWRGKFRI